MGTKLKIINKIISSLKDTINTIFLMFSAISRFFTRWNTGGAIIWDMTIKQILFTGLGSLLVVTIAGVGIGAVVSVIFFSFPIPKEIIIMVLGQALTVVIITELGPFLTALVLISRSGTAIATEIGNMNANKEFDTLTSMGIDVTHFVITPRVIGMVLAILCLNIYLCFLSVITSAVFFNFKNISYNVFFNKFFSSLEFRNIFLSLLKSLGFGFIISAISCYQGYKKGMTFTEVPKVLTKSTGQCIIWCFFYYAFITILSYL